jgi:hypothetical protein
MNSPGGEQAAHRVLPAHEGLGAGERAGLQVDLRLVVHDELVVGEGRPQLGGQGQPVQARLVALAAVVGVRAAGVLRLVERDVRALEQLVERRGVLRVAGDADAALDRQPQPVEDDRLGEHLEQPAGQDVRVLGRREAAEQHGELVPAEPADRVGLRSRLGDAVRDLGEQHVPGGVPERVVDLLEVVEVDDQQRALRAGPRGGGHGRDRPVLQQAPVAQAGERVVRGLEGHGLGVRAHLPVEPGVLQRGADAVREGLQDLPLAVTQLHGPAEAQAQDAEPALRAPRAARRRP